MATEAKICVPVAHWRNAKGIVAVIRIASDLPRSRLRRWTTPNSFLEIIRAGINDAKSSFFKLLQPPPPGKVIIMRQDSHRIAGITRQECVQSQALLV